MTFDEFKAAAERLGLEAREYHTDLKGFKVHWWDLCSPGDKRGLGITLVPERDGWSYCGDSEGSPAAALSAAARLLRPGVVTELRKWLNGTKRDIDEEPYSDDEDGAWNEGYDEAISNVLAKLDELEGK